MGHVTLIEGDGPLVQGEGPVRTGVTAILPRGKDDVAPVFAGYFSLNGNGEMTGTVWLEETGELMGPVTITSTSTVGAVRDAAYSWIAERVPEVPFSLPSPPRRSTLPSTTSTASTSRGSTRSRPSPQRPRVP